MPRRPSRPRLPTPDEIARSPELAILAAIENALDIAIVALVAAQPELQPTADQHDATSTAVASAADLVVTCTQSLAAAIADYRAALPAPPYDLT